MGGHPPWRSSSVAMWILAISLAFASVATAFHSSPPYTAAAAAVNFADNRKHALHASLQTPTGRQSPPSSDSSIKSAPPSQHHPDDATSITSDEVYQTGTSPASSHVLSVDDMNPLLKFNKNGKDKVLNATGLYHLLIIILTLPGWIASMEILRRLGDAIEGFDEHREKFDYSGKLWSRTYLKLTDCYPEIAGDVARLQQHQLTGGSDDEGHGACLFVANHASFLDIPVLCCVLDPVFKFIAKDSLTKFPGVGQQLVGGEHVLIDRTTKRSQFRSFKQAITYLQNGVPIMAFPEGARSPDGRLMPFKGGIFSMAVKAKVPIVPLSLSNTHAIMPGVGLMPVQSGKGKLRVFVHGPICVEGKSEEEIAGEVRKALLSELPMDQHPLEGKEGEI